MTYALCALAGLLIGALAAWLIASARFDWREITKVAHYYLSVDALTRPMQVREDQPLYGGQS